MTSRSDSLQGGLQVPSIVNETRHDASDNEAIVPILTFTIIIVAVTVSLGLFTCLRWIYLKRLQPSKENSSNLTPDSTNSNYGTCDDKKPIISRDVNKSGTTETNDKKTNTTNDLSSFLAFLRKSVWSPRFTFGRVAPPCTDEESACDTAGYETSDRNMQLRRLCSGTKSLDSDACSVHSLTTVMSTESLTQLSVLSETPVLKQPPLGPLLNYSVRFNKQQRKLAVSVISLENVDFVGLASKSDLSVYVKLELSLMQLNENEVTETSQRIARRAAKTRLIRQRTCPVFDETFEFDALAWTSDMATSFVEQHAFEIIFNICNANLFGRDELIARLVHLMPLRDLVGNTVSAKDADLCQIFSQRASFIDTKADNMHLGQLIISLLYNDLTNTINVHIIKGSNFYMPNTLLNKDKIPSSFVKVYLLHRNQRIDKKQTAVVEHTRDPLFDEKFEFDLRELMQLSLLGQLQPKHESSLTVEQRRALFFSQLQLLCVCMDWDQSEKSAIIGKIELHMQQQPRKVTFDLNSGQQQTTRMSATEVRRYSSDASRVNDETGNWFDIFKRPNRPIICAFQLK